MDKELRKILNKLVMDWTYRSNQSGQGVKHIDDTISAIKKLWIKMIGKNE